MSMIEAGTLLGHCVKWSTLPDSIGHMEIFDFDILKPEEYRVQSNAKFDALSEAVGYSVEYAQLWAVYTEGSELLAETNDIGWKLM